MPCRLIKDTVERYGREFDKRIWRSPGTFWSRTTRAFETLAN